MAWWGAVVLNHQKTARNASQNGNANTIMAVLAAPAKLLKRQPAYKICYFLADCLYKASDIIPDSTVLLKLKFCPTVMHPLRLGPNRL
ncbi:hypothetical protein WSK_2919 [Novosphingobium sp. Rr 2-17]|nr:hypothetical protein WSK_2919 [Novosphingobium sp. Rr 2-17]